MKHVQWAALDRMNAARLRVRQFCKALVARVSPEERQLVRRTLPAPAEDLFFRMPRQDQRHGLDVFHGLKALDASSPELLAAALLHDVAKSDGVRTWHRVAFVLLRALWSDGIDRIAAPDAGSWRYPFWVQMHHSERGAQLAELAGCTSETAELVRHHHSPQAELDPPLAGWLISLQEMDGKT